VEERIGRNSSLQVRRGRKKDGNTEVTEARTQRAQRRKKEGKNEREKEGRSEHAGRDNHGKFGGSRRKHCSVEVFVFD
jgi:hypothetical protein